MTPAEQNVIFERYEELRLELASLEMQLFPLLTPQLGIDPGKGDPNETKALLGRIDLLDEELVAIERLLPDSA